MNISKVIVAAVFAGLTLPGLSAQERAQQKYEDALKMTIQDTELRVSGGNPFDQCGILLGLLERSYWLPGGALLKVEPLVLLARGEFDADGEWSFDFGHLITAILPPIVFAQAISTVLDSTDFKTSNVVLLGVETSERDDGIEPQPVDSDTATAKARRD